MAPRCPAPIAHRSAHPSSLRIARSQPERRSHTDRSPPHWRREIPHPPGEATGPGDFAQAHANSRAASWRCWSQPQPRLRRPAPRPPRPRGALPGPAPDGESNPRLSTWSPSTPIVSARRIAGHNGLLPRSHDGPIRLSGSAPATCPRDPVSPCAAAPDPLIDSGPICTSTIRHDVTGIDDTITAARRPAIRCVADAIAEPFCDPPAPTPGPISRDQIRATIQTLTRPAFGRNGGARPGHARPASVAREHPEPGSGSTAMPGGSPRRAGSARRVGVLRARNARTLAGPCSLARRRAQ